MGSLWAVARQTILEIRRKRVNLLLTLLSLLLFLGALGVRGDNTLTGGAQSFLTYYIAGVTFVLSITSLFLSKSLSDELVTRQVYVLMAKPLARWEFLLGKWLGITIFNGYQLMIASVLVLAGQYYLLNQKSDVQGDIERMKAEVFVARHAIAYEQPDFTEQVNQIYEQKKREGAFAFDENADEHSIKSEIWKELDVQWHAVPPNGALTFDFKGLLGQFTAEKRIQLRYYLSSYGVPPDEILRYVWRVGNPDKGSKGYEFPRRDVANRYHTVVVPADAVASDGTLTAQFINFNVDQLEPPNEHVIAFESGNGVEVLFDAGTFAGNLSRLMVMVWCRLMFLTAVGLLAASVFSFPVAALVCAAVFVLASSKGFLDEAFEWFKDTGLPGPMDYVFVSLMKGFYLFIKGLYWIIPNFAKYQGLELLVTGRNVTLMWALQTFAFLGIVRTGIVLLVACILFQRRQVAELSV